MKPKTGSVSEWMAQNAPPADASDIGILVARCMIEELRGNFKELDENPTHILGYLGPWNRQWGEPFTREELELMINASVAKVKPKRNKKPRPETFMSPLLEDEL